jgi:hypothetical protein
LSHDLDQLIAASFSADSLSGASSSTPIATTVTMYVRALDYLLQRHPAATSILDYGAGLGLGTDTLRARAPGLLVDSLEPHPARWRSSTPPTYTDASQITRRYDLVICTSVLNVLERPQRDAVVRDLGLRLAAGGRALVTVRGWLGDVASTKYAVPADEPHSILVRRSRLDVFQKGFGADELQDYLRTLLGPGYRVTSAPLGKVGALVVKGDQ